MHHQGSCHCKRVSFKVEGTIEQVVSCNCSMCRRKGILMWFVPREHLQLETPEANASVYTFNKHVIQHRFCPVCGIHAYGEGSDSKGQRMAAINVRCLEGVELAGIPVQEFDGRSL